MAAEPSRRLVGRAVWRGLRGRCPACGKDPILQGYIKPVAQCRRCGENFVPYQTADFAPYLVVFVVGLIFTPIIVASSLSSSANDLTAYVLSAMAVACALLLLPRAKGAAIALLWAPDIRANP